MNDTLINLNVVADGSKNEQANAVKLHAILEKFVHNKWGETQSAFTDYLNCFYQETQCL